MSGTRDYPARVVRVVDGDTVICEIDLGFRVRAEHSIRIAGVDAPELFSGDRRAEGAISKEAARVWVDTHQADGDRWPLLLRSGKDTSFGRWIGTLVAGDGSSLAEAMVEGGFAEWSKR